MTLTQNRQRVGGTERGFGHDDGDPLEKDVGDQERDEVLIADPSGSARNLKHSRGAALERFLELIGAEHDRAAEGASVLDETIDHRSEAAGNEHDQNVVAAHRQQLIGEEEAVIV